MSQKVPHMESSWLKVLREEFEKPYMKELQKFLSEEVRSGKTIYPPEHLIFNAFCQTPFEEVKVVIVGQDPYHGPEQAHGLSFSVAKGISPPPSLQNIFKEISTDLRLPIPDHGCLLHWSRQGVLLLNATLTVRAKEPRSHYGKGWEKFTDAVIEKLVAREDPLVFILWGKSAQEKCEHILDEKAKTKHMILTSAHPSPYSATGFFGCRHFSKANEFLLKNGKKAIDWSL